MIRIYEMPDSSTNSAYKDTAKFAIYGAIKNLIDKNILNMSNWDVKGTKFTLRLGKENKNKEWITKKVIIILLPTKLDTDIKFINDKTKSKDKYTLTYNTNTDIQEITNKILKL